MPSCAWPLDEQDATKKQRIYNIDECQIISHLLLELNSNSAKETTVGIIAPYKHQVIMLRKTLQIDSLINLNINIDSVDGFQGKECDIVIFSLTRTVGSFRFLADARRLNVALSRARDKIIVVGNVDYADRNDLLHAVFDVSQIRKYDSVFSMTNEYLSGLAE